MPNEKAGELFNHILEYVNDNDPETKDLIVELTFEPIKQQLKRDLEKWDAIRGKRSIAGKKSAEARANKNKQRSTNLTSVKSVEQRSTNPTVSVNVNVNDNVSVNDIKEYSKDVTEVYNSIINLFSEKAINEGKWKKCIKLLIERDGYEKNELIKIIKKAKSDSFWNKNFLSLLKLRTKDKQGIYYVEVFKLKFGVQKNQENNKTKFASPII